MKSLPLSQHVFTYGSLMFPQVWEKVVTGRYRCTMATASGYARYALTEETYPGMIVSPTDSVQGIVYFDVSRKDIAALDAFEGTAYRRDTLPVRLENGDLVEAYTYIYLDESRLSKLPWHPARFQMQRFLDTYWPDKLSEKQ